MRVVVVFGGGGAKSLAHAGAWKALLEAGLRPSHIVGTSMGAVMGAAFAAGSSYDRLVGIALSLHRNDFAALDAWALAKGVFARSTLKPEPLKRTIAHLVPATRFAELQIPFTVTTTDLDSGELVLFGALGQDEPPATKQAGIPPLVRAHGEAIRVMMAAQTERAIAAWPKDAPRLVVVRAVAEREATFAVDGAERYLDAGYQKTRAALA